MAAERQYGVTDALSQASPNERDLKLNETLVQELKAQNNYASKEESEKKQALLDRLRGVLHQMVQDVGKRKGLPQAILQDAGGEIYPYGSYLLGVWGPGADIDLLMVAPKHVTREEFFEYMPDLLKKSIAPGELGALVPVPETYVPIIKLKIQNVEIDLIFTNLQLSAIPKGLELQDNKLLRGLSDVDMRCVNGTRVTSRLLRLVPQPRTFRTALRAIKLWAQRRALYGGIAGFPAGVSYGMMVARVCQLYPKAAAPLIIMKFFHIIRSWPWPKPLRLQESEFEDLGQRQWDPQSNRIDAMHYMPVITPCYPSMNSTHTIGPSTKKVLMRELERGEGIVNGIYDGKRQWKDLFEKHTFFTEGYKHYIRVIAAGRTKEGQKAWSGLIQSRVKKLVGGIEQSDAKSVELVQAYNKGIEHVHECTNAEELEKTLDGGLDSVVQDEKARDAAADIIAQAAAQADTEGVEVKAANGEATAETSFPDKVWTSVFYLGIGLRKGATGLDISMPIQNFKGECTLWSEYNPEIHSIRIKHVRNFDLPADVFEVSDIRPTRAKKSKAPAKEAVTANNKRSFAETGLDENGDSAKRRQSANGTSTTHANGTIPRPS